MEFKLQSVYNDEEEWSSYKVAHTDAYIYIITLKLLGFRVPSCLLRIPTLSLETPFSVNRRPKNKTPAVKEPSIITAIVLIEFEGEAYNFYPSNLYERHYE
jgi:hypothetical protein